MILSSKTPTASIATGWNDPCRTGLTPAEEQRLFTAYNSSYAYDALGREIIDSTYGYYTVSYLPDDLYYSQSGQVIEEKPTVNSDNYSYCG